MTWHADTALLEGYRNGTVALAAAASVEAHLTSCASCRAALALVADRDRLARTWSAIADRLDERPVHRIERLLARLGLGEHRARLVMVTPTLRMPSLVSLAAILLGISGLSVVDSERDGLFYLFLVLAPLLPLAGVAVAFGGRSDPAREITTATSTSAFELALVRTVAIVGSTIVLTAGASIPFPHGWDATLWLLPAFGLSAAALALATFIPVHVAGTGVGLAWTLGALLSWRANRLDPDVLDRFAALRPSGQLTFAILAIVATAIVVVRREALDSRRIA